nr:hypothetical protein [Tanacetum cinerariifolium]
MYRTPCAGHDHKPDSTNWTSTNVPDMHTGVVSILKAMVLPLTYRRHKANGSDITSPDHPLTLTPEFGPGVTPRARLTRVASLCRYPSQPLAGSLSLFDVLMHAEWTIQVPEARMCQSQSRARVSVVVVSALGFVNLSYFD